MWDKTAGDERNEITKRSPLAPSQRGVITELAGERNNQWRLSIVRVTSILELLWILHHVQIRQRYLG